MENEAILREWFERVDSEKTGSITAPQLKTAFAVGNLELSLSVVQQMIRMYDFDRNGTMSFEEFVALNKFLLKVQSSFSALERGRGYISPEDVYEAMVKIGFSLDSPAFYTVCEKTPFDIVQDQRKYGADIPNSLASRSSIWKATMLRKKKNAVQELHFLYPTIHVDYPGRKCGNL